MLKKNFELFSGLSDKSLLSPENILRLARSLPQQVDIQVRSQEYFELFNSILTLFYMVTWYLLEQEIIIKGLPLKQSPFVQWISPFQFITRVKKDISIKILISPYLSSIVFIALNLNLSHWDLKYKKGIILGFMSLSLTLTLHTLCK